MEVSNSILLSGLVAEAPLRLVRDGQPVAVLRVETRAHYADPEGTLREHSDFHTVEAEGEVAFEAWDLAAGDAIVVRGRLAFTTYHGGSEVVRVAVLAQAIETAAPADDGARPVANAARITAVLAEAPLASARPEIPVTWLTLVAPGSNLLDGRPTCTLASFAVGGLAVEAGRLARGARVTLQGHLYTTAPAGGSQQVRLAATAWG